MKTQEYFSRGTFFLLVFLSILAGFAVLKLTAAVCIPVVSSILLSFAFLPLVKRLSIKPLRLHWTFSVISVILLFIVVIFIVANILTASFKTVIVTIPKYEERFYELFRLAATTFHVQIDEEQTIFQNLWTHLTFRNTVGKYALGVTGYISNVLIKFSTVLLFSTFFLLEVHFTKSKFRLAVTDDKKERVRDVMSKIGTEVTSYISIKALASLATGIFISTGLLCIGMDFPLIWGVISFIMNFIPIFGSLFTGALAVLFAILQFYPSPLPVIAVGLLFLLVNIVIGNILEPRIVGRTMGISPFVILISLSLWSWLWGFIGMLLAVPIMVIIKIICLNVSFLQPIGIFIGGKPDEKLAQKIQAERMAEKAEREARAQNR